MLYKNRMLGHFSLSTKNATWLPKCGKTLHLSTGYNRVEATSIR